MAQQKCDQSLQYMNTLVVFDTYPTLVTGNNNLFPVCLDLFKYTNKTNVKVSIILIKYQPMEALY